MSTQSIIDKAVALNTAEEEPEATRAGAWETAEEFIDRDSGLGVVIRKRIRGRPSYSVSLVHFDERGSNRYIPFPLDGLVRPLHEMTYLLMQKAEAWISEHPLREHKRKEKGKRDKDRRDREQGGLSSLAKRDAEKQGKKHVGKTERKRRKKTG